jgi:hypothetical protein
VPRLWWQAGLGSAVQLAGCGTGIALRGVTAPMMAGTVHTVMMAGTVHTVCMDAKMKTLTALIWSSIILAKGVGVAQGARHHLGNCR